MLKQIMIAHDLSPAAEVALARAAQLAQQHQARLIVTHCLSAPSNSAASHDLAAIKQQITQRLQAQLTQLASHPATVEWVVKAGQPSIKLAELVRAYSVDLLVVGQHHQASPEGFSGTTLEHLLQKIKVPVLLAVEPVSDNYQRSLIAMDFSQTASRALQQLIKLISADTQVTALHICEMAEQQLTAEARSELEWQQQLFAQVIKDECVGLALAPTRIEQRVVQGELFNCLEQALQQIQPQLLALGRHGRGEMADALLGSLTHSLLAAPPCDLLVVS